MKRRSFFGVVGAGIAAVLATSIAGHTGTETVKGFDPNAVRWEVKPIEWPKGYTPHNEGTHIVFGLYDGESICRGARPICQGARADNGDIDEAKLRILQRIAVHARSIS